MTRIVIVVEGGVIQNVLSEEPVEAAIIDYDLDCADPSRLIMVPQHHPELGGPTGPAFQDGVGDIWDAEVRPGRTVQLFEAVRTGLQEHVAATKPATVN